MTSLVPVRTYLQFRIETEGPGQPQSMHPWAHGFSHPGLSFLIWKRTGWIL